MIWLGAYGPGATAQEAGGFTRNLLKTFMKSEMDDRVTACEVVIESGGTVFHAGSLADAPLSATRRTLTIDEAPRRFFPAKVSRATVAAAMLDEAETKSHPGQTTDPGGLNRAVPAVIRVVTAITAVRLASPPDHGAASRRWGPVKNGR